MSNDSAAIDLAAKLEALGKFTQANDLYVAVEPDQPDSCLTLYDTPGEPPQWVSGVTNTTGHFHYPRVQLRSRSSNYSTAVNNLRKAVEALEQAGTFDQGDFTYQGVFRVGEATSLGRDEEKRHIRVLTIRCPRTLKGS